MLGHTHHFTQAILVHILKIWNPISYYIMHYRSHLSGTWISAMYALVHSISTFNLSYTKFTSNQFFVVLVMPLLTLQVSIQILTSNKERFPCTGKYDVKWYITSNLKSSKLLSACMYRMATNILFHTSRNIICNCVN